MGKTITAKPLYQVALIVLVLAVIVACYQSALGGEPEDRQGPEIVEVIQGRARTPLTEDQKSEALAIVMADSGIREIIEERGYTVGEIVPWRSEGKLIGGGVQISFNEPVWMERDWPEVDYDKSKYDFPHYRETKSTEALLVANLYTRVDFAEKRLVAITPLP